MPREQAAWGNWKPYLENPRSCIQCGKTTRSHVLFATNDFEPATKTEHDFVLPVCHGCYIEHSAETLLENGDKAIERMNEAIGADISDILYAVTTGQYRRNVRTKSLGSSSVQEAIRSLEPGDVFLLNDNRGKWVVVPHDQREGRVPDGVIHSIVKVGSSGGSVGGGGFVESNKPLSDEINLAVSNGDGLEIRDVQSLELIGHVPLDTLDGG